MLFLNGILSQEMNLMKKKRIRLVKYLQLLIVVNNYMYNAIIYRIKFYYIIERI